MDDLLKIAAGCKCGVFVTVNEHRDYYQTAKERLEELGSYVPGAAGIPDDVRAEMIARDVIVDLQFYPDTPISFHNIYHYDLAAALAEGVRFLEEHRRQRSCNTATCG